jgi:hypothetical protein
MRRSLWCLQYYSTVKTESRVSGAIFIFISISVFSRNEKLDFE